MNEPCPPSLGLRHVALRVVDLEASERFYVEVFGFRVEWRPDADNVYLSSGPDNLALHRVPGPLARTAGALDHFGIAVPEARDVDLWAQRMGVHKVTLATEPRTHRDGARSFYVDDPDGNRIQIIHHPPISAFSAGDAR